MIDRKFVLGATIATGAVLLVPGVAAALARAARPLLKAAIKTGATAYEEFSRAGVIKEGCGSEGLVEGTPVAPDNDPCRRRRAAGVRAALPRLVIH